MDFKKFGRLADPACYPGVTFGRNVLLYGKVKIGRGSIVSDNVIIGIPASDTICEPHSRLEKTTTIKGEVYVGPFSIIHYGAQIGQKVRIDANCRIGEESRIGSESRIIYGTQIYWDVSIGKRCVIGGFCSDKSKIHDQVVMFGKLIHKFSYASFKKNNFDPIKKFDSGSKNPEKSPTVHRAVVIGFDAIIVGGITIKSFAYIAAGAIVTKNVPSRFEVKNVNCMAPRRGGNK